MHVESTSEERVTVLDKILLMFVNKKLAILFTQGRTLGGNEAGTGEVGLSANTGQAVAG